MLFSPYSSKICLRDIVASCQDRTLPKCFIPLYLLSSSKLLQTLWSAFTQTSGTQIGCFNCIPSLQSQFDVHVKKKGEPLHSTSAW